MTSDRSTSIETRLADDRASSRRPELIILRGLPASGKTTWAHAWVEQDRAHRIRVSKDDLREMIDHGVFLKGVTEDRIIAARDVLVKNLMQRGLSVVVDDTNLRMYHVKRLARIAALAQWDWSVKDFTTPLEECIRRDTERQKHVYGARYVGESVIRDMHSRFLHNRAPLPVPSEAELLAEAASSGTHFYFPDKSQVPAVIFDIDGTLANKGTRSPFDETRVHEDTVFEEIAECLRAETQFHGNHPVFVSGRTDGCRGATMKWIESRLTHSNCYDLYMRPAGDTRPDYIVKMEIFDKYIRDHYWVRRVYDDRNQVVEMWRSLGLTVLQVADGAF